MPTWSISPRPSGGTSSSASISSSDASCSLWPSRVKNFTPLYSGGLCDAEMTTPRSSASSATAGVGRTPPRIATPPADSTPRAKASISSTPDARVSRPTKTLPPPTQVVDARPSRSTRSAVRNSPTTPRTPSVPKYLLTRRTLTLRELRRLAGLVQTGLLALDLACVARQEALPLQRHAELRVDLDDRACDPVAPRPGLARGAAAVDADADVVRAGEAGGLERRQRQLLVRRAREVL